MKEIWKPIEGHDGYIVSNLGNVKSLDRTLEVKNRWGQYSPKNLTGKMLKARRFTNGYMGVNLGRGKCFLVHRLVASAFISGDTSMQVNHKNGIRHDNRAENLEWLSCSDNHRHSYAKLKRKTHEWSSEVIVGGVLYKSSNEAARAIGVTSGSVSSAIIHGHKVKNMVAIRANGQTKAVKVFEQNGKIKKEKA